MATRLLHRAVSRLLRSRAPTARPQRTVQLVAHQDSHAQCFSTHRISFSAQTVVYAPLLPRHRRLATRATAKEVSPSLEDDEEDLGSDIEDFDEDFTEESVGRQIVVGDAVWSKAVYSAVLECLQGPDSEDLELYMFRASPDKFVEIRIDKLTNKYGSPSLEDIERVARDVNDKLVESLGEDLAGEIEIGMSSPGADRPVEWHELQRFTEVPLEVTFYPPADPSDKKPSSEAGDEESGPTKGPLTTHVMFVADILGTDQVVWKLADVKANSPGKGRRLNKRMREQRWTTTAEDVVSMNIHVDL